MQVSISIKINVELMLLHGIEVALVSREAFKMQN